jgi:hypothetical protein
MAVNFYLQSKDKRN